MPGRGAVLAGALPLGALLMMFVFSEKCFRGNRVQALDALTLGLLIVAG